MHRALPGLASLLSWIRLQIWGKKNLLLCSCCGQWQTPVIVNGSRWAPKRAGSFPFASSLSFCNSSRDGSSGHAIICLKGNGEQRIGEEMRGKWLEVWILPLVSCRGAGARLGATHLTLACLSFSTRGTEDAYHLRTAPPRPRGEQWYISSCVLLTLLYVV